MSELSYPIKMFAAGAAQFSYLERGKGPALVLLHGIGSGAKSWARQLADLSDAFRVLAWDAPGYGKSSGLLAERPGPDDYARSLAAFLHAAGIRSLHLVGHSLGAIMAARFAADHPDRILSLTLAGPSAGHARLSEKEGALLRDGRLRDLDALGPRGLAEKRGPRLVTPNADEKVRRMVIDMMAQVRPDGYRQAVRMLTIADTRADVIRLAAGMRVQFVYGDGDLVNPPESIRAIAAERPGAPVREISGAGHAVYLEQPDKFNAIMREFLTER